jgi:hypothetical protein
VICRPFVDVATPPGGWGLPWPNVAEIEAALPHENWTLVGGLMTQLHAFHAGLDVIRPTNDVDIVLHLETTRGVAATAATALEGLGYVLATSIDPREEIAHRFVRGDARVDVVTTVPDVVDVLGCGLTSVLSSGPLRRTGTVHRLGPAAVGDVAAQPARRRPGVGRAADRAPAERAGRTADPDGMTTRPVARSRGDRE